MITNRAKSDTWSVRRRIRLLACRLLGICMGAARDAAAACERRDLAAIQQMVVWHFSRYDQMMRGWVVIGLVAAYLQTVPS